MKVLELEPTESMCSISEATARLWTGKTKEGTTVHLYVVAVAVPLKQVNDAEVAGLVELYPCDPLVVTSEQLGIGDTTFRN